MKNRLLLPAHFKKLGVILVVVTTGIFIGFLKFNWEPVILQHTYSDNLGTSSTNLLKEVVFTLWMIGLIVVAFSKEKREDEYIAYLRLASWQYSVLVSFCVSIFGTWLIYGMRYLAFAAFNMLTVPVIFIIIFNLTIYFTSKSKAVDEK